MQESWQYHATTINFDVFQQCTKPGTHKFSSSKKPNGTCSESLFFAIMTDTQCNNHDNHHGCFRCSPLCWQHVIFTCTCAHLFFPMLSDIDHACLPLPATKVTWTMLLVLPEQSSWKKQTFHVRIPILLSGIVVKKSCWTIRQQWPLLASMAPGLITGGLPKICSDYTVSSSQNLTTSWSHKQHWCRSRHCVSGNHEAFALLLLSCMLSWAGYLNAHLNVLIETKCCAMSTGKISCCTRTKWHCPATHKPSKLARKTRQRHHSMMVFLFMSLAVVIVVVVIAAYRKFISYRLYAIFGFTWKILVLPSPSFKWYGVMKLSNTTSAPLVKRTCRSRHLTSRVGEVKKIYGVPCV